MIATDEQRVSFGPAHALGISAEEVRAFYENNWPRRIALSLPRFYCWQFLDAPENGGKDWNCLAVRDGQILGVMGLNRRSFKMRGETIRAAELTTWVVAEAARGLGVGRGVMQSIQQLHDLTVGFGISDAALPIYMTSGYRRLKHIPRYFRIYDIEAVRQYAKIERLGERLTRHWSTWPRPEVSATAVKAEALSELGAVMERSHNLYIRDAAHLAWRYDRHPVYRYEAVSVSPRGGGPGRAGVILRRDEIDGMRFLHVLDVLGASEDVPLALSFIDAFARETGQAFADFYCTASAVTRHFLATGWFSCGDDDCFQLMHLFYPPELRTPQTTSMVYWANDRMAELSSLGRLYITKQDLDLDRPTLAFYEKHALRSE